MQSEEYKYEMIQTCRELQMWRRLWENSSNGERWKEEEGGKLKVKKGERERVS